MVRYTREELLRESGARSDELAEFEEKRLLVANRRWRPFGKSEEWFTDGQLKVLRWLVKARRAEEMSRRVALSGRHSPST